MEEVILYIVGFYLGFFFKLNWSLEIMVFLGRGKLELIEKNCKGKVRVNNMLNLYDFGLELNLSYIYIIFILLC